MLPNRRTLPATTLLVACLHVFACEDDRVLPGVELPWNETSPDVAEVAPTAAQPSAALARGASVPTAQQTTGALSGRIVFMNGGHGWTFDPTYWRLQRPVALNSMNEDYGNLDQLNLFANYCFNAGAVVVPMRPIGRQTNEVVLDNDDAGVSYSGAWSDSSSPIYYGAAGDLPYRFASLANSESATATYTPTFPVAGIYPVYTWVRHGPDRADQLYRIRHTGGETTLRIPHHMVGNGWVYLGQYHFYAGSNPTSGSVIISNLRGSPTGSVVIADAIRFGNGMGSIDRGGGVSGYPREEENSRYWVQASLGQGQTNSTYETDGDDEEDSWYAPPRMSRLMNREESGSMFKRIHISFHSNAGGGRGTVGLVNSVPTPNQAALAQICGSSVNDELVALGSPPLEVAWNNRGTNITYSGGYAEISANSLGTEMDATIIEVAYHDNADDARLMRDPKARSAVARAAMHAVIRYMNQFDLADPVPLLFPPEPPTNPRATGTPSSTITVSWSPPVTEASSGAPTHYLIYQSTNGLGFGNPVNVGNTNSFTFTNLAGGRAHYFRITAANAAGESFPSEVVGCYPPPNAGATRVLYVNAFDRFDRTTNLRQDLIANSYLPPGSTGGNERVLPERVNSFDYVVAHGQAIAAAGIPFDSCQNEATTGEQVALASYPIVIWACGNESTADESFSSTEQTLVSSYLSGGGSLFVSGSEIAWDLDRTSGPSAADRAFINNQLRADYAADSSGSWSFDALGSSIFAGNASGLFDNGDRGIYRVGFPDLLTPLGGATTAIRYTGNLSGAAAIVFNGAPGKLVYFGFPFETIIDPAVRAEYMADILNFFGATVPVRFDSVAALAGPQVALTLSGAPGVYTVQTSAVLNVWANWQTITNPTGIMSLTNNAAQSHQFYRAYTQP